MLRTLIVAFSFFAALAGYSPYTSAMTGDCTLVMGYSVTRDWFISGGFEAKTGIVNGEWEMVWDGGASVRKIAYEGRWWAEWDADNIISRCSANARLPSRIIFHTGYRSDESGPTAQPILDVVAQIRARISPTVEIYLMGQVGSTTPETCDVFGDNVAAASIAAIRGAIAADPTLKEAVHPVVPCSQFADSKGHLSAAGASNAATQVAEWVAGLSEPPAPPSLVSCERVATYSDGSTVSTPRPLEEC